MKKRTLGLVAGLLVACVSNAFAYSDTNRDNPEMKALIFFAHDENRTMKSDDDASMMMKVVLLARDDNSMRSLVFFAKDDNEY